VISFTLVDVYPDLPTLIVGFKQVEERMFKDLIAKDIIICGNFYFCQTNFKKSTNFINFLPHQKGKNLLICNICKL